MSTRTVIEINHDYMQDLLNHPEHFVNLLRGLSGCEFNAALYKDGRVRVGGGITILAQRHHSESITVKVK